MLSRDFAIQSAIAISRSRFDDHGEKKFISSIVIPNLKKIDRQPPEQKKTRAKRARKKTATKAAAKES